MPVQGQLHADLHVKELFFLRNRAMSMEVQVKKRVSLVLIVPVLVHQVQVHVKFGDIV